MLKPNHQGPGDDILALMNSLTPYKLLLVALTCLIIQGCGGGTSSGTLLQQFNVDGRWTGTMSNLDGTRLIPLSMTLIQVGVAVDGVVSAPEYECVTSGKIANGTATQTPDNTGGDNPLTTDNEMASRGTLTINWVPTSDDGGSPDRNSLIQIALAGTSSDLSGHYAGYWNNDTQPCGTILTPTSQVEGVMTLSRG